jgi:hypothetical protein
MNTLSSRRSSGAQLPLAGRTSLLLFCMSAVLAVGSFSGAFSPSLAWAAEPNPALSPPVHVAEELTKRTYACAIDAASGRVWCGTSFGLVSRGLVSEQGTNAAPKTGAPEAPLSASAVLLPDSVSSLAIAERQLYAAAGAAGLQIFSMNDPAHPEPSGSWTTPSNVIGVDVDRAHVFVALGAGGWAILARTRGGGLRELCRVETEGYVRQVLPLGVSGDALVAVAEGSAGFSIWRFSDPRRPVRVAGVSDTGGEVRQLARNDTEPLLAIANGRAGLSVFRVNYGATPTLAPLAATGTPDLSHGVTWAGAHLLAAVGSAGLLHSNARLDPVRARDLEGSANKVIVHQGQAYIAVDHAGLVVLPLRNVTRTP